MQMESKNPYAKEIKEVAVAAFQYATRDGPIMGTWILDILCLFFKVES